ncbi:MAG: DUF2079 domain-containing protein [Gaiellaceae bacterium]
MSILASLRPFWGRPKLLLALAIAAWGTGLAVLSVMIDRAFHTGRFDLGNMIQAVSSTAHGHFLRVTDVRGHQISRLASHFDPILAAFAPLWRIWPSSALLLSVQASAVALGAIPVYRLARKHLRSDRAGLAFALAYLLYPATGWLVLNEFHPVAFACPLLLFAFWYMDEDRLLAFALFSSVAVMTKEEVGFVVAGYGTWYALARRRRLVGAAIAAAGIAVSIVAIYLIVPHFNGAPSNFYARYTDVGGSPAHILVNSLVHPLRFARVVFALPHLLYLAELLLPLLALPLLSPLVLVAFPEVALNLLSATPFQSSVRFHYTAAEIPPLIVAAVYGAARIAARSDRRRARLPPALVAGGLLASYLFGPLLFWTFVPGAAGNVATAVRSNRHDEFVASALKLVPAHAPVSASNGLGAHLSDRDQIYSFPVVRNAHWVVVDEKRPSFEDRVESIAAEIRLVQLRRERRWRIVFERDGVVVFERQGL